MTNSAASLKNFCIYLLIFPANLGFTAGVIYLKSLVLQSNDGIKFCLLAAKDSAFTYVRTKKNTWVILSMKDGTRSKLTPESELQILKDASDAQEVKLTLGGVFTEVKKRSEIKPHFTLRTKATTMGVRGTRFFTSYGISKNQSKTDDWMCVDAGTVEVADITKKNSLMINSGEGILIDATKGLTEPKSYEWTKKLNWEMDPSKALVESSVDMGSE